MASTGLSWVGLNPTEEPKKRAPLLDWALSAEELKQRVKQREKRARRAEREAAARRGEPLPPPVCHRPRVADNAAAHDTLVKRKRKAEKEALLALTHMSVPDFARAEQVVAADFAGPAGRVAAEKAAALVATAARAATEKSVAAAELSAIAQAERAEAERAEAERAEVERVAAACVEAAMGEVLEETLAELTTAEAKRLREAWRLARQIASDRGFVDEARSRSNPRMELACFICLHAETDAYMPCCSHRVHRACIAKWHGFGRCKSQHKVMAPTQGGGWMSVDMARVHECPMCGGEMQSARVPII